MKAKHVKLQMDDDIVYYSGNSYLNIWLALYSKTFEIRISHQVKEKLTARYVRMLNKQ